MKRLAKMLMMTCVAALALAAVSAVGASAATFTATATGTLTGDQTTNQVFTTSEGGSNTVTCKKAHTSGTIVSTAATTQEVTVDYTECTANFSGFFNLKAEISPAATYELHANGEIDILSPITITVPSLGCKTTVGKQSGRSTVTYTSASGKITQSSAVKGISSSGEGICPGGTTGTYTGTNVVERVGGGFLAFDA